MTAAVKILLQQAAKKSVDAIDLLEASLQSVKPFDTNRDYTAAEREPYDALCDRYVRAVEIGLKYFRTYEKYQYAENSDTLRDLLNRMEKAGLITTTSLWIDMRDIRNRIVHDYLPTALKNIYDLICGRFGRELVDLKRKIIDSENG